MSVRTFKGGNYTIIADSVRNLDAIEIPAQSIINSVHFKGPGTAGSIALGAYVDPIPEILSTTVTGAPTAAGTIDVALRGAPAVEVPVEGTETIEEVVALLAAANYPGWTVTSVVEDDDVFWTAREPGVKSGVTTISGPTGFTKLGPSVEQAGVDATCDGSFVAEADLASAPITALTVLTPVLDDKTVLTAVSTSTLIGKLIFNITSYNRM